MASVSFRGVWKLFGGNPVVSDLNLDAADGEFLVLVGPSGCGKTTTLRMLAGLEIPSHGSIWIGDQDVTLLPPGRRDIAMVFQSYALYPHMTVYKNLAFGPSIRKVGKAEIKRQIEDVAGILGVQKLLNRKPNELSGGQRQRVALGRVMLRNPQLSLLDEPLSNLDAALRVQMRVELVKLQRRLGVTTVYVTHDQVEAMTMGDRIAVLDHGRLLQVDTPAVLYSQPNNLTVATFIGSPRMNVFAGNLRASGRSASLSVLGSTVELDRESLAQDMAMSTPVSIGIRPHDLFWAAEAPSRGTATIYGVIEAVEPTGAETFAEVRLGSEMATIRLSRGADISAGTQIPLAFDPRDIYLFHGETELALVTRTEPAARRAPAEGVPSQAP